MRKQPWHPLEDRGQDLRDASDGQAATFTYARSGGVLAKTGRCTVTDDLVTSILVQY